MVEKGWVSGSLIMGNTAHPAERLSSAAVNSLGMYVCQQRGCRGGNISIIDELHWRVADAAVAASHKEHAHGRDLQHNAHVILS